MVSSATCAPPLDAPILVVKSERLELILNGQKEREIQYIMMNVKQLKSLGHFIDSRSKEDACNADLENKCRDEALFVIPNDLWIFNRHMQDIGALFSVLTNYSCYCSKRESEED